MSRFTHSKNLVSYLGLNPSVVESGNYEGGGALHQHGRGSLRALLIQASKRLLTCVNPLQKWGLSVALRRGQNKAAVAVARKLTVAIWHVMQGHWNKTLEETTTLLTKLTKLATELGVGTLRELGYASKLAFQEQKLEVLRTHPVGWGNTFPQTPSLGGTSGSAPPSPPQNPPQKDDDLKLTY